MAVTTMTMRDAQLIRGGSEADVSRLLHVGGRIVKRGRAVRVREKTDNAVLQIPFVLIAFGASRRRILILLSEQDAHAEPERSRPGAQ